MSSIIKVDTIQNQSGANIISESSNTITVGASGDTITVPSGATLSVASGATLNASSATVSGLATTGNGISLAELWTIISNSSSTSTSSGTFTSPSFYSGLSGSAQMTQSSGAFTFPSTGYYLITFIMNVYDDGEDHRQFVNYIRHSTNSGSSFGAVAQGNGYIEHTAQGSNTHASCYTQVVLDITDTSTHRVNFGWYFTNSSLTFYGDNRGVTAYFQRLGDT